MNARLCRHPCLGSVPPTAAEAYLVIVTCMSLRPNVDQRRVSSLAGTGCQASDEKFWFTPTRCTSDPSGRIRSTSPLSSRLREVMVVAAISWPSGLHATCGGDYSRQTQEPRLRSGRALPVATSATTRRKPVVSGEPATEWLDVRQPSSVG